MISAMPEQRLVPFPGYRRQAALLLFAGRFVDRARGVSHGFFENKPTGFPHSFTVVRLYADHHSRFDRRRTAAPYAVHKQALVPSPLGYR